MFIHVVKKLVCLSVLPLLLLFGTTACNRSDAGGSSDSASNQSESSDDDDEKAKKRRGKKDDDEEDEEPEDEDVPVEVVSLERGRIESILRFSTNLEAESEVQVFSEAARKVIRLNVEEGDKVRQGQVLIRLQNEEQQTELARVESQLAKSRREFARKENLYGQQLISEEEFTEATYNLEQLELSLADARRRLGYTEVKAPIGGTITARMVKVGDQVTVNQHLFDIIDFDSIVARIYVPEKELARLRVGQIARILAEAAGSSEHRGEVDRIAPRVDPRSGTVKVTVAMPPSEGLLPGMYVTVELITEIHEDAVLVPKKALVYDAEQLFVFRLKDDNSVERLLIRPALEDRDNIEPAGVLEAGDQIVIAGQASLKDGSQVRLVGGGSDAAEPSD